MQILIRLLLSLMVSVFYGTVFAQSSADFSGKWTGYLQAGSTPLYTMTADFTSIEPKKISGKITLYDFNRVSTIIKSQEVNLEYDKQKRIAFFNTSIPNASGLDCTGWF